MRLLTLFSITYGLYQSAFAPIACAASPNDAFAAVWTSAVTEQSAAADAELQLQKSRLALIEQQHLQGLISPDELQRTREQTRQANEWAQVLRRQRDYLKTLDDDESAADSTQDIWLRIPGLPAAFFDDDFCYVGVPANPRTLQLASQIAELTLELEGLSTVNIQQSLLSSKLHELEQAPHPGAQHAKEMARVKLQQKAASLDLTKLEQLLVRPVQFSQGVQLTKGLWSQRTAITRHWILDSRKTLLAQALRQYRGTDRPTPERQTPEARADLKPAAAISSQISTLQREIYVANNRDVRRQQDEANDSPLASRLAVLMRLAKESHNRSQQELAAAAETSRRLASRINVLSNKAERDAGLVGQLVATRRQAEIAVANEHRVIAEEQRCRAFVRFAMAQYRFESGRDTESDILHEQRAELFELATDRRAELQMANLQLQDAQARLEAFQQLNSKGLISRQELSSITAEYQIRRLEQQRIALRIEIAQLCHELLKHYEETQILALDLDQNSVPADQLPPKSPDA